MTKKGGMEGGRREEVVTRKGGMEGGRREEVVTRKGGTEGGRGEEVVTRKGGMKERNCGWMEGGSFVHLSTSQTPSYMHTHQ